MNTLLLMTWEVQWSDVQWIGVLLLFAALMLDAVDYYKVEEEQRERHGFFELQTTWARHTAKWSFFVGVLVLVTAGTLANMPLLHYDPATLIVGTICNIGLQIMLGAGIVILLCPLAKFCYHLSILIYCIFASIYKGLVNLCKWLIK